ncbi:MAG TPA: bifunctional 4-hydroxy-2-oxoglutarate aldolase/2-dehydro-3-deoxy-phosphogluconate aldolase [Verrucomicrobiae bacterium]
MARFPRLEVLNRIVEVGLVPVFYHGDLEVASQVLAACAAGGVTVFEFTNRGDHAIDVFQALERRVEQHTPGLILGAGSIADEATAALYVAHGANFIVGPSFNERVARFCNRRKVAYVPGCATATEIATAEEAGSEVVKLFPCELVGGPAFVKALLGPCPWTRIMATGISNVTQAGLAEWFKAGIVTAGIGRELLKKEFVEQRDYAAITRRAAEIRQWIQAARGR